MSAAPAVSVVVPLFNEQPTVLQASLRSVAEQTAGDFECLVIDESTEPATVAACESFCRSDARFRRLVPEQHIGLAASLNLGIAAARAPLIARFDSDDVCLPDRLEVQTAFLAAHPEIDVVGGALEIFNDEQGSLGVRRYPQVHRDILRKLQLTTPLAHPTVVVRHQVFERCGGYDPSYRNAEDLDLWLRLANCGVRFANVPQVVVRYRQQATRRHARHWHYNLRARIRNFAPTFLPRRIAGIAAVFTWTLVPPQLQEPLFRLLLLRRGRPQ